MSSPVQERDPARRSVRRRTRRGPLPPCGGAKRRKVPALRRAPSSRREPGRTPRNAERASRCGKRKEGPTEVDRRAAMARRSRGPSTRARERTARHAPAGRPSPTATEGEAIRPVIGPPKGRPAPGQPRARRSRGDTEGPEPETRRVAASEGNGRRSVTDGGRAPKGNDASRRSDPEVPEAVRGSSTSRCGSPEGDRSEEQRRFTAPKLHGPSTEGLQRARATERAGIRDVAGSNRSQRREARRPEAIPKSRVPGTAARGRRAESVTPRGRRPEARRRRPMARRAVRCPPVPSRQGS